MNIFNKIAVSGLVLSMASFASAAASISGSTDFRVTLPEILVLYHWDDAHLILTDVATTSANDSDPREISDIKIHELTSPLATGTYTITQNPIDPASAVATNPLAAPISVTLKNSWAVRSLSSGPVHLALTNPNTNLLSVLDNNSKVITSAPSLVSGSLSGTTIDIPSGWTPVIGDISFKLDVSAATKPGEYNTRGSAGAATTAQEATDTFLLTLTGN